MTLSLESPVLPLIGDSDGVIRVGQTRVTLDTVVSAFNQGATAEQIAIDYDALKLSDIYSVINYYLNNRDDVDRYLDEQRATAESLRQELTSRYDGAEIRQRLLARRHSSE